MRPSLESARWCRAGRATAPVLLGVDERAGDLQRASGSRSSLLFAVPAFAAVNLVLVGAWLVVVGLLRAALRRKEAAQGSEVAAL